jgi:hypothetical protein
VLRRLFASPASQSCGPHYLCFGIVPAIMNQQLKGLGSKGGAQCCGLVCSGWGDSIRDQQGLLSDLSHAHCPVALYLHHSHPPSYREQSWSQKKIVWVMAIHLLILTKPISMSNKITIPSEISVSHRSNKFSTGACSKCPIMVAVVGYGQLWTVLEC